MLAKSRLDGLIRAEKPAKPGEHTAAAHLVRHQKELILLVFCG
jgi:hypothetical protein